MTESMYQVLLDKINRKQVNIGIIGLGYVGLPLAREFLKKNFRVIGFDIDDEKVSIALRLLPLVQQLPQLPNISAQPQSGNCLFSENLFSAFLSPRFAKNV